MSSNSRKSKPSIQPLRGVPTSNGGESNAQPNTRSKPADHDYHGGSFEGSDIGWDSKKVQVNVNMERWLRDKLRALAGARGCNQNDIIKELLVDAVRAHERKHGELAYIPNFADIKKGLEPSFTSGSIPSTLL